MSIEAEPNQVRSDLCGRRFRANSAAEIVPVDRLGTADRVRLADIEGNPEVGGIVRWRDRERGTLKAIDRAAVGLIASLEQPQFLPEALREPTNHVTLSAIARLVLDGLIEVDSTNGFISGPSAHSEVIEREAARISAAGPVGQLTEAALIYAERLDVKDTELLSSRLYFFNRRPTPPDWRQRFGSRQSFEQWLGLGSTGLMSDRLAGAWKRDRSNGDWLFWWARLRSEPSSAEGAFKLYISPRAEDVPTCLARLTDVAALHDATCFKVGRDIAAMQRPDKIVVYFNSLGQLQECAAALRATLGGIEAHGVPFTAAIDDRGILSFGVDPPRAAQLLRWRGADSWRTWLAGRLAAYVVAAKRDRGSRVPARQFARDRIALDGINTTTWTPDGSWLSGLMQRTALRHADH